MSSLENALRILSRLSKDKPVLRVGELCRELSIPKSSVSRLMRTMAEFALLEREPKDLGYVAGRRGLVLADLYLARHTLLDFVEAAVDALIEEFGFVGYVAVPDDGHIVIIRRKQGTYPLQLVQEVGQRMPAFPTAIGRAHLARLADAEALAFIAAAASAPVPTAEAKAALAAVRDAGTATTVSTVVPGIDAVGTVVADPTRGEMLGFSISYPSSAVDASLVVRMARRVREEGAAIGARLGDADWLARGHDDHGVAGEEHTRGVEAKASRLPESVERPG